MMTERPCSCSGVRPESTDAGFDGTTWKLEPSIRFGTGSSTGSLEPRR
jgi:hypothetical protein